MSTTIDITLRVMKGLRVCTDQTITQGTGSNSKSILDAETAH
jgi:hypothetical protein